MNAARDRARQRARGEFANSGEG